MKKIFMISVFLLAATFSLCAQTYLYQHTYTVDKDTGVKQKGSMAKKYFTFTNNACYESDKNGNLAKITILMNTTPAIVTIFEGVENGVYIYKEQDQFFPGGYTIRGHLYYYVAPDKSRINSISTFKSGYNDKNLVRVYEKIDESESQKAPIQLY